MGRGLSELQRWTLAAALDQPGSEYRPDDALLVGDVLLEVYGIEPTDGHRPDTFSRFVRGPEYQRAVAAVSRSWRRLRARGLADLYRITCPTAYRGRYSRPRLALRLTDRGREVARPILEALGARVLPFAPPSSISGDAQPIAAPVEQEPTP